MPGGYSFRPRLWPLVLAALACAGGIALGQWQAGRAAEKRALGEQAERASVTGTFLAQHTVLLDNKQRRGRVGYEVITPLKLADSDMHVLVNRGWIAAGASRAVLPEVQTPAGVVRVEGVVRERLPRVLVMGDPGTSRVRQSVDVDAYGRETGLRLLPHFIEQHSSTPDGLLREWPRPEAGAQKNESYSFQWYSLAALAAVLGLAFSFRRVRPH